MTRERSQMIAIVMRDVIQARDEAIASSDPVRIKIAQDELAAYVATVKAERDAQEVS